MRRTHETQLPLFAREEMADSSGTLSLESLNSRRLREFDEEAIVTSMRPESLGYALPQSSKDPRATIDDVYIAPEFTSTELQTSLRLLAECLGQADIAIKELQAERRIPSDEAVLRIHSLLPELFACRALGDSFGALINSLLNALINRRGLPLSLPQLVALRDIIKVTRNEPFMKFDKAVDLIMEFEEHDFHVEPHSLQFLSSFLDES
jgi:hypothetical protein